VCYEKKTLFAFTKKERWKMKYTRIDDNVLRKTKTKKNRSENCEINKTNQSERKITRHK